MPPLPGVQLPGANRLVGPQFACCVLDKGLELRLRLARHRGALAELTVITGASACGAVVVAAEGALAGPPTIAGTAAPRTRTGPAAERPPPRRRRALLADRERLELTLLLGVRNALEIHLRTHSGLDVVELAVTTEVLFAIGTLNPADTLVLKPFDEFTRESLSATTAAVGTRPGPAAERPAAGRTATVRGAATLLAHTQRLELALHLGIGDTFELHLQTHSGVVEPQLAVSTEVFLTVGALHPANPLVLEPTHDLTGQRFATGSRSAAVRPPAAGRAGAERPPLALSLLRRAPPVFPTTPEPHR
eukprot:Hpha_TRINITY_DN14949_c3_g8::TRINITY_DN14949_c3_g8_i1::g.144200::m.144200